MSMALRALHESVLSDPVLSAVVESVGVMPELPALDYSDGRTKQSFKDETDINKIMFRAQREGVVSHLAKYGPMYGDFTDMPDLLEANARLSRGQEVFDALPSELRSEFNQNPADFFAYVNDPANKDELPKKLPMLAQPGRQHRILDPKIQQGIREAFVEAAEAVRSGDAGSASGASESPSGAPAASSEDGAASSVT